MSFFGKSSAKKTTAEAAGVQSKENTVLKKDGSRMEMDKVDVEKGVGLEAHAGEGEESKESLI